MIKQEIMKYNSPQETEENLHNHHDESDSPVRTIYELFQRFWLVIWAQETLKVLHALLSTKHLSVRWMPQLHPSKHEIVWHFPRTDCSCSVGIHTTLVVVPLLWTKHGYTYQRRRPKNSLNNGLLVKNVLYVIIVIMGGIISVRKQFEHMSTYSKPELAKLTRSERRPRFEKDFFWVN